MNTGSKVRQKAGLNRGITRVQLGSARTDAGLQGFQGRESKSDVHVANLFGMWLPSTRKTVQARPGSLAWLADTHDNADVNAALNILALGLGAAARGEAFSLETSVSREKIFMEAHYGSIGI